MELFGVELSFEEFDRLMCEQNNGKELKVENGKIVAFERIPTKDEIVEDLRTQRQEECFSIINRGKLWYDTLTEEQLNELNNWYNAWLNVTETEIIPIKPTWIK